MVKTVNFEIIYSKLNPTKVIVTSISHNILNINIVADIHKNYK